MLRYNEYVRSAKQVRGRRENARAQIAFIYFYFFLSERAGRDLKIKPKGPSFFSSPQRKKGRVLGFSRVATERGGVAENMQSSSMKREISEAHDTIRFGINAGVKADLAPPHPLQSTIQSVRIRRSPPFPFVRAHETLTMSMGLMWGGGRLAQETKFWADKKKFGTDAIYGSALNIRKDLDAQILSRFFTIPFAVVLTGEIEFPSINSSIR
jgi:hypothetical protein